MEISAVEIQRLAEFPPVVDNHEVEIERNRTVRGVDDGCPRTIRVDRIGPAVRVETRVERGTVDDYMLSSREITLAIESRRGHSNECCFGRKARNVKQEALHGASVFARERAIRAVSLVGLSRGRLGHGRTA